jgi:hypothetical protein
MMKQELKISDIGWLCLRRGIEWVAICKLTEEQIKAYREVCRDNNLKP